MMLPLIIDILGVIFSLKLKSNFLWYLWSDTEKRLSCKIYHHIKKYFLCHHGDKIKHLCLECKRHLIYASSNLVFSVLECAKNVSEKYIFSTLGYTHMYIVGSILGPWLSKPSTKSYIR